MANESKRQSYELILPDFTVPLMSNGDLLVACLSYIMEHWLEILPARLLSYPGLDLLAPRIVKVQYLGDPYPGIGIPVRDDYDDKFLAMFEMADMIDRWVEVIGPDKLVELARENADRYITWEDVLRRAGKPITSE